MNYKEAREFIASRKSLGIRPGLERMRELAERLGNPQNKLKIIHVAGTNGKGSVCAMLSAYLCEKGYSAGTYTSPYVSDFNEQIRINQRNITDEQFAKLISEIKPHVDIMDSEGNNPTEYEITTAAAFLFFAQQNVDFAVIEVGLGGLEDATNIIASPLLSVITSISLDHVNILGSTIEAIAEQKAGIIKKGCPVVVSPYNKTEVLEVIKSRAAELGCKLILPEKNASDIDISASGTAFSTENTRVETSLVGVHQVENAMVALTAVKAIFPALSDNAIYFNCSHPARFEIISKEPLIILDGAHNADGARALRETLDLLLDDKAVGIMGMLADKDYESAVKLLAPKFEKIFTVTPNNPRALTAEKLAECISHYTDVNACGSVCVALDEAKKCVKPLVIFGSLYLAEEIRPLL